MYNSKKNNPHELAKEGSLLTNQLQNEFKK